jgi:hypothetical protein
LATPGIASSKTVVPLGTAPSASPSARRFVLGQLGLETFREGEALRRTSIGRDAAVEDEDANDW